ncbi:BgTH12-07312 [Blumeria graminis f. sp. triticale]|nr:BgTH12-07312 [Blumeria graminis f. sp. triticale]
MVPRTKTSDATESNAVPEPKATRARTSSKKNALEVPALKPPKSKTTGAKSKISNKINASKKPLEVKPATTKAAVKRRAPETDHEEPAAKKFKPSSSKTVTEKSTKTKKTIVPKPPIKKLPVKKKISSPKIPEDHEQKFSDRKRHKSVKPSAPTKDAPHKAGKPAPIINAPPTQRLNVFVFGEGSAGELGLGAEKIDGKSPVDVKRPRLNPRLDAKDIGIVQIAAGGMHCAALTFDNKILTWGVNDQGALGREASQGGKMKVIAEGANSDSETDDEGSGLNPNESEPREIDWTNIEEDTKFAAVFAGDSTTFALTIEGRVYGWGTFRGNDGILGFRHDIKIQYKPMLIPELKNIIKIECGTNHVLALDTKGKVFTWGAGEQNQLARRVVSRSATGALVPREFGLGRCHITHIGCGDYHSFAIDDMDRVYSWGLNAFGQTGVPKDERNGEEGNTVQLPTVVDSLSKLRIKQITGGAHHSLAVTESGELLIWGRIDNNQGGMEIDDMPQENLYFDENSRPRYALKPITIPNINSTWIATGNDTCIVIDAKGRAYSWGFSSNYQTGQGTDEDVVEATLIDNTAVRGKRLTYAGVGGQFGILAGLTDENS